MRQFNGLSPEHGPWFPGLWTEPPAFEILKWVSTLQKRSICFLLLLELLINNQSPCDQCSSKWPDRTGPDLHENLWQAAGLMSCLHSVSLACRSLGTWKVLTFSLREHFHVFWLPKPCWRVDKKRRLYYFSSSRDPQVNKGVLKPARHRRTRC